MAYTLSDFLRTRAHTLRHPAPILQFYQVELPDSSFVRLVDFADPDAGGSLPTKIPFNGVEFDSYPVKRGDLRETADGTNYQLPVTVADPAHSIAFYVREYAGLIGADVTFWVAAYDRLDTVADAFSETFEIVSTSVSQSPDAVTFILGHPNLYETRTPKLFYDPRKCTNAYQNRHTTENWCDYPSSEFPPQKREDFRINPTWKDAERRWGWYTQHSSRADLFDVDTTIDGALSISSTARRIAWKNRERYGPNIYRIFQAENSDIDVETKVEVSGTSSRVTYFAGLLAQTDVNAAPPVAEGEDIPLLPKSSWIFWAVSNASTLRRRIVKDSVLYIADIEVSSSDEYLRLVKVDDDFTLYSKATTGAAWTQRSTAALSTLGAVTTRIGLFIAADTRSSDLLKVEFPYIRFAAGGLTSCGRSWEDCQDHKNTIQFNGFREMPDDRLRN